MMGYPQAQMQQAPNGQQMYVVCVPVGHLANGAAGADGSGGWGMAMQAPQGVRPAAAHMQAPQWFGAALEGDAATSSQAGGGSSHWADPSATPFTPSVQRVNDGQRPPADVEWQAPGQGGSQTAIASESSDAAAALQNRKKKGLVNQSIVGGTRPSEKGRMALDRGHLSNVASADNGYSASWTSTIRALNLEANPNELRRGIRPHAASEFIPQQMRHVQQHPDQMAPVPVGIVGLQGAPIMKAPVAIGKLEAAPAPPASASRPTAAQIQGGSPPPWRQEQPWRNDSGLTGTPSSGSTARVPGHSKLETPDKVANRGAGDWKRNRQADQKMLRDNGNKGKGKGQQEPKEVEKEEATDKPLAIHEFPTLGGISKKGKAAATNVVPTVVAEPAAAAAPTPDPAEKRTAGTAWGKAGGAIKAIKEAEAAKVADAAKVDSAKSQATELTDATLSANAPVESNVVKSENAHVDCIGDADVRVAKETEADKYRIAEETVKLQAAEEQADLLRQAEAEKADFKRQAESSRQKIAQMAVRRREENERKTKEDELRRQREAEMRFREEAERNVQEDEFGRQREEEDKQQVETDKVKHNVDAAAASQEKENPRNKEEDDDRNDSHQKHLKETGRKPIVETMMSKPATERREDARKDASADQETSASVDEDQTNADSATPRSAATDQGAGLVIACDDAAAFCEARSGLLAFRTLGLSAPEGLASLRAVDDENAYQQKGDNADAFDRNMFGTRMPARDAPRPYRPRAGSGNNSGSSVSAAKALPPASTNAYKVGADRSENRADELRRSVQSLLNKICPENVGVITTRITETNVASTEELELVIRLIMNKAHTEAHYCETYADLVFNLKAEMPDFPSPIEGSKPISFKSSLLNCCQNEFETMIQNAPEITDEEALQLDSDEREIRRQGKKRKMLAIMKFIGNLFLRQLLTPKIIGSVIYDLAMCEDGDALPAEYTLECICELLNSIGYTLEAMPAGKAPLTQVCGRLLDLKLRKDANGRPAYSKRVQFQIQDLIDTRTAGWTKKVFKAAAKTREEIRNDQLQDMRAQARGIGGSEGGQQVIAGARPSYLSPKASANPSFSLAGDSTSQDICKARSHAMTR